MFLDVKWTNNYFLVTSPRKLHYNIFGNDQPPLDNPPPDKRQDPVKYFNHKFLGD